MNNKLGYIANDKSIFVKVQPTFDVNNNFEAERVWEFLGNYDVIQIDEINRYDDCNMALSDGEDVYFITGVNWEELMNQGRTVLAYQGPLEDFIDPSIPSHIEFLKWLNG